MPKSAINFLKLLEPGLTRIWHEMGHPGPICEGTTIHCDVCDRTFVGTMPKDEYDRWLYTCPECGHYDKGGS